MIQTCKHTEKLNNTEALSLVKLKENSGEATGMLVREFHSFRPKVDSLEGVSPAPVLIDIGRIDYVQAKWRQTNRLSDETTGYLLKYSCKRGNLSYNASRSTDQ